MKLFTTINEKILNFSEDYISSEGKKVLLVLVEFLLLLS